jgi:hypothetical protein
MDQQVFHSHHHHHQLIILLIPIICNPATHILRTSVLMVVLMTIGQQEVVAVVVDMELEWEV